MGNNTTSALSAGFVAVTFAVGLVGCTRSGGHPPAPAPSVIDLLRATPAPPERLAATVPVVSAEFTFPKNRARFFEEYAKPVAFILELPPKTGATPNASASPVVETPNSAATQDLSPSEYLTQAANSFRRAHSALLQGRTGKKPAPAPLAAGTAYAGRGVWIADPNGRVVSTYANQSVYPNLTFKSGSNSYLYAPTMLAANRACIEVVTAYSSGPPAIWTWNWCSSTVQNPARLFVVSPAFISKYVRDLGANVGQYTVQTSLLPDGKTWAAKLYDYQTSAWDAIYTATGSSLSDGGTTGWDFFEEHAAVDSQNQSDYCKLLPSTFASTNIQVSYDRTKYSKLTANASTLNQNSLTCDRLQFKLLDPFWRWSVFTGSG